MEVRIICRGKKGKFRLVFINREKLEKTGYEVASYFSLSLLLRMAIAYFGIKNVVVECRHRDDKLEQLLKDVGVSWSYIGVE